MDNVIDRFRTGHHNAHHLLDVFANQLRAFEHGRMPDMLLMRDIVDCLNRYAAIGEDAYEGELIDALTRADGRFASARLVLTTEHAAITELGGRCQRLIEDMIGGIVHSRTELLAPGWRYLRRYQAHLSRERSYLHNHRRDSGAAGPAQHLHQSLPKDPLTEFTDLCNRVTHATAHLATDEFGLSVCAACGTDAAAAGGKLLTSEQDRA
ncbi:MAG: hypothetical protein L0H73_01480 [Nitrococcus sp.]|nr:hypothetical protein [Nitrococcus sp.]